MKRLNRKCLLKFVFTLTAIFSVFIPNIAQAEDSSCGEPLRSIDVDVDFDGTTDRTVEFDQCYLRTFNYGGTDKKIIVYYTLTNGAASDRLTNVDTSPSDGFNDIAFNIGTWTEEAWRTYLDYGFNDPLGRDDLDVYVFDMRRFLGWCCGARHYEFDTPHALNIHGGDLKDGQATSLHEMWHAAQWSAKGSWIDEGTASNMTDHVNLPIDIDNANDFIGRVNGYLNNDAGKSLTTQAYNAALWWKYYMERTGSITTEPDYGVDAMKRFWDNLGSEGMSSLDSIIRDLPGDDTLESVWVDFTVANFAKELSSASVPGKYQYADELQAGAPDYPAVALTVNQALAVNDSITQITQIPSWSAQYFQLRPDGAVPLINVEFRQDTNRRLGYSLLLIKGNDLVDEVRHVGRDFVQSIANDNYDKVVIVVSGLNEFANYRYSINGTQPLLNLLDPISSQPAYVGDPAAPEKMLVKLEVLSPVGGGTPIEGLDPTTFDLEVGGIAVSADRILTSSYIQGQYWLVVRPPVQPSAGAKNLKVDISSLSLTDTENNAVRYDPRGDSDNVIIFDRSGSMGDFGKLGAAQNAARLYVDSWRSGDKIGVVSFNQNSTLEMSTRDWNEDSRELGIEKINSLTDDGATAIGDGLLEGIDDLDDNGDATHQWAMVVFSDGLETADKRISDFLETFNEREDAGTKNPVVHTIALGADADRANLQNLAVSTRGTYHFAAEPSGDRVAFSSSVVGIDLPNDLAEIYRIISEAVVVQQQIYSERGIMDFFKPSIHTIDLEGAASEAVIAVNWQPPRSMDVELKDPNGNVITPHTQDVTHTVYRVGSPLPGAWEVNFKCGDNTHEFCPQTYLVEAAIKSKLTIDLYFGLPVDQRISGHPMPLIVALTESTPIKGAVVKAQVTNPRNELTQLTLFDDGSHGDGGANDGIYANTLHNTSAAGSYVVKIDAHGYSTVAGNFTRKISRAFDMAEDKDGEGDGMGDGWETAHGLDPNVNDAGEDPDGDDLTNLEEYNLGTDPQNADSDSGGESDGSEVECRGDPNDPRDDRIRCILDFQVTNLLWDREEPINPKASVLRFSVESHHDHFIVWRTTDPSGEWQVLNDHVPPTGLYIDDDVELGTTYYYRIQAVDINGNKSCIIGPRSTTPKLDPLPPEGYVLINNGAEQTDSKEVQLQLIADADAKEMIISNEPHFAGANWEPYQNTKPWTLADDVQEGDMAFVLVRYRDAENNESETLSDGIRFGDEKPSEADGDDQDKAAIWILLVILVVIFVLLVLLAHKHKSN